MTRRGGGVTGPKLRLVAATGVIVKCGDPTTDVRLKSKGLSEMTS